MNHPGIKFTKVEWSPLVEACARGNTALARELLSTTAARQPAVGAYVQAFIHQSPSAGEVLEVDGEDGDPAQLPVLFKRSHTPLTAAVEAGSVACVELLLASGAQAEARLPDGSTAVHLAATLGSCELLALLCAADGTTSAEDMDERTPLFHAAREGKTEAVTALLRLGASASRRDALGWTPLCHAARFGHAASVAALLESSGGGAQEQQALKLSIKHGHADCARTLLQHGVPRGSLAAVAKDWQLDVACRELATAPGAAVAHDGFDSVHTAVHCIARAHGQDVSWTAVPGFELTLEAACGKATSLAQLLRADCSALRGTDGLTALLAAATFGHVACLRLLLDAGVPAGAATASGVSALMAACREGRNDCAAELLRRGADAAARDAFGWSALCHAAKHGHAQCARLLLQAGGCALEARTADGGDSALHIAARFRQLPVVHLLLASSADAYARNALGRPVHCFGHGCAARCSRLQARALAQVVHQYERRLGVSFPPDVLRRVMRLVQGTACTECGLMEDESRLEEEAPDDSDVESLVSTPLRTPPDNCGSQRIKIVAALEQQ